VVGGLRVCGTQSGGRGEVSLNKESAELSQALDDLLCRLYLMESEIAWLERRLSEHRLALRILCRQKEVKND